MDKIKKGKQIPIINNQAFRIKYSKNGYSYSECISIECRVRAVTVEERLIKLTGEHGYQSKYENGLTK